MVLVTGVLPVFVDDRLQNRTALPQTMPATKCDAKLKASVSSMTRKMIPEYSRYVFPNYVFRSPGVLGALFGRTQSVDVDLISFETSWDAKGVMRWKFVWNVPVQDVDIDSVRDQIGGGISDGWGESVDQICRFGPLCTVGDDGLVWRLATSKERKSLTVDEAGRYAVLLTTVGSKFTIKR